jgi:Glycine zipper
MLKGIFPVVGLVFIFTASVQAAGVIVYPSKGQSASQQKKDEGECMSWASGQTGFDPTAPMEPSTPPPQSAAPTTSAGRGALRGALVGVGVGAIAGNAGKGAAIGAASGALIGGVRRRDQVAASEQQQQAWANQQAAEYQQKQSDFNRAYGVCLQGRGYAVSQ